MSVYTKKSAFIYNFYVFAHTMHASVLIFKKIFFYLGWVDFDFALRCGAVAIMTPIHFAAFALFFGLTM